MRKITPTLFILLRNKVTLTLLAVIVAVSLYGWRSARDTYQLITGKEKVCRYVVDGELFAVPRKYSPQSAWAPEVPESQDIVLSFFNFSFVYPKMISWDEARHKDISNNQLVGGMLYVDRYPGYPNPWAIYGYKKFGDRIPISYKHIHDYLRHRATSPTETQSCLTDGEHDARLGMTRYILNDTPEHHPSYYSEIYIKGRNTCTPIEWLKCDINHCMSVMRYQRHFAIEYRFNKQFLYEHQAVRQATTAGQLLRKGMIILPTVKFGTIT
ncbi:MAG: hypothetical protein AB7U30_10535 [Sulfuricellaceae bacterium]|jgi:hypothetical protein